MKNYFIAALCLLATVSASAQINGKGYYRVQNYGSKYYMHVTDNTGSVSLTSTDAETGALRLYKGIENAICNPATVIYFNKVDNGSSSKEKVCDFQAQGVGVHDLIGYYAHVYLQSNNTYQVYASQSGLTKYLSDDNEDSEVNTGLGYYHSVVTTGTGYYRNWIVTPIDNATDNYVAIKPKYSVGGKHYAPYYAAYPFTLSEGMKAYVVSKVDAEKKVAVYSELPQGSIVPASTPVIIECASTDIAQNKITLIAPGSHSISKTNILKGVYFCNDFRPKSKAAHTEFNASTMRVMGVTADGSLGFVSSTNDLHINDYVTDGWMKADGKFYLNANESYLPVATGTPAELKLVSEAEYEEMNKVKIIKGDLNGDQSVDSSDLMLLVNHLLDLSKLTGDAALAADVNDDKSIDSSDLMLLVNMLLSK